MPTVSQHAADNDAPGLAVTRYRLACWIDPTLRTRLKTKAASLDLTVQEAATRALRAWVESGEKEQAA